MPLTTDRDKTAIVGVVLTTAGLIMVGLGTMNLPIIGSGRTFAGLMLIIFGLLLSVLSMLLFVLPAAYDYLDAAWKERD